MSDPVPFVERLKKGLERLDTAPPDGPDAEAVPGLRRSLQRTLARLAAGPNAPQATFRYQVTGGKALLFQGLEALPVEPAKILQLLNTIGVDIYPGEGIDLDGALTGWVVRPEVNLIDTNVRAADATLQQLKRKTGHDRDHAAAQQAESTKIRLRSRMTLLVAALQAANADIENPAPLPDLSTLQISDIPAAPAPTEPKPEPKPDTTRSTTVRRIKELPPTPEMVADALWKMLEAIDTTGFQVAAIGEVGYMAWDPNRQATKIELLVSSTASQRETLLAAARAQGFQPSPAGRPLSLRWIVESEPGRAAAVDLVEAATPFLKQVLTRAQTREVFQGQFPCVSCEDLVVMFAGSDRADDRDSIITLLQANIATIDHAYLRKEAQTAGVFEELKEAWAKAKSQQGLKE
jgi:hypothetical protein